MHRIHMHIGVTRHTFQVPVDAIGLFQYLEGLFDRPITRAELRTLDREWDELSIVYDVGIEKESIAKFIVSHSVL